MERTAIAIVGIGCHVPGKINGAEEMWLKLCDGVDGITTIPKDRWDFTEYYDPDPNKAGKSKTNRAGFVEGIDLFDNEFFNIFPKEAERIDPQQRFLLHCTFEAIEDAGDKLEELRGSRMAVYMGMFMNDYADIQKEQFNRYDLSPHVPMGTSLTSLANRISYLYDFKGPSISIDTACSSSLVSVHLACQSIWNGEADSAMAGGVNIMINPESTVMMSKGNFLSPDGACKSFDATANGYVRSEGAGVVYLKPLDQALKDNNKIYGIIKGTSCNSDGYTSEGFTVPSETAQTAMLKAAYANAGVDVNRVQYVEAHGTGTPVGDPIETKAFANVFSGRSAENPLMIGSVKSNIGHLEGAAGIIGLIKLSASLKNKVIPGNLHFNSINPKIDLENWKLSVVAQNTQWPEQKDGSPRLGGVNSFGAGGTNAHVVVEEYIADKVQAGNKEKENQYLFVTSAQTEQSLKDLLVAYREYLDVTNNLVKDICYNTGKHRSALKHRIAIAAKDKADLIHKIDEFVKGSKLAGVEYREAKGMPAKIAFVFTGQGPQWYAMGKQLIEQEPLFRDTIYKIEQLFKTTSGWSLLEEMTKDEHESRVSDTRIAQPAIMAIQIALVELWKKHGVRPKGVTGHSIGEVAAAYTAGALTLEQAVEVIYHRSRGQHKATDKGKMLAVSMTLVEAEQLIEEVKDVVSIAAVNGPEAVTLAGDAAPLERIAEELSNKNIFNRFLNVNVPFHSHHMEPLKEELIDSLKALQPSQATLPLYSTVTAWKESGTHLTAAYWYDNVRQPVYFSQAVKHMIEDGFNLFIEIGPHPALSSGVEALFEKTKTDAFIFPSIRRKEDEKNRFLQTLGAIYTIEDKLDWDTIYPHSKRLFDLPGYTWQKRSFWFESKQHKEHRLRKKVHPLIEAHEESGLNTDVHRFSVLLDRHIDPYIDDHKVDNVIIFPATGHLEIAMAAATKAFGNKVGFLEDINFDSGLFLPDEGKRPEIKLEVTNDEGKYWILSKDMNEPDAPWIRHSSGKMNTLGDRFESKRVNLEELKSRIDERLPVQPIYNELKQSGLEYGKMFRAVKNLWTVKNEILGKVELHESLVHGIEDYYLHPSVLDACLHTIFAAKMGVDDEQGGGVYLPVHIDRYKFYKKPASAVVWSYVRVLEASDAFLNGDFCILDDNGDLVAEVRGLRCKYIEGSRRNGADMAYSGCYEYEWQDVGDMSLKFSGKKYILLVKDPEVSTLQLEGELLLKNTNTIKVVHRTKKESLGDVSANFYDADATFDLLKEVSKGISIDRIVVAFPLFMGEINDSCDSAQLATMSRQVSSKVMNVFKAIIALELQTSVWVINRRSELVTVNDKSINLLQSVSCGLARVMNNEYPLATVKVADMGDLDSAMECERLASILCATSNGGNESEFAFRDDKVFVKRLNEVTKAKARENAQEVLPASATAYIPFLSEPGIIDSVRFQKTSLKSLGPNDVEIDVRAAALNFKDVLNAMGMLSAESVAGGLVGARLGLECSGVVARVGSAVTRFKTGDAVLAIAPDSLAGKVVTPEHCIVKKPAHLSFDEAATITIVYLTAYYCLHYLAQMERGERLLIHSGTGGVGIAAIKLAQLWGVEVYATAGSEEKRNILRDMGVKYVYNSRTLDFYDEIMKDTKGEGVDIVLNSLSGKAILQSMKCLRAFGRFIEIGKTDIYSDMALHLKRMGENLSYHAVDIDRLMAQKPARGQQLFENVIRLFNLNKVHPHPFKKFPITDLSSAIQYISAGRQIGKVVIGMEGEQVNVLPAQQLVLDPKKAYIITGGASGLGIELAKWLADKGARKLVLISRSGPKTEYDRNLIKQMMSTGVTVDCECLDIASSRAVINCIGKIRLESPIGGVIHSAAVLRDVTIPNMTEEVFDSVFMPKVMGAWNLHQALGDEPVDFFLNISSISSVFGLPGQSNYSAANNFLDKLVAYRKLKGLKAQSVNLGVLGQYSGMSRDAGNVLHVLDSQGWTPLTLKQVTSKMERVILEGSSVRMAANIDWLKFRDFFAHLKTDGKYAHLLSDAALNISTGRTDGDTLKDQLAKMPADEATGVLSDQLKAALARILGTGTEKIDETKSISAIGLDSLMMNQLRNWIQQKLDHNYPLMKMAKGPSIRELSAQLLEVIGSSAAVAGGDSSDHTGITTEEDIEIIDNWFIHRKGDNSGNVRLFMFHSMGAGASMFSHFLYHPPANCDVYAAQLPGRENRMNEPVYTELGDLLADLERVIVPLIEDVPFAIYGHSYGGIIAFELTRLLRKKYGREPVHFFASATMAPQITLTWKNRDMMRESAISSTSEKKLLGLMSYIDDLDFVKKILPGMRRDMPLLTGYDYKEDDKLDCPITVFSAIEDEVTFPDEMAEWKVQTNGTFRQELVHGDHWFVSRNKEFIKKEISKDLVQVHELEEA